MSETFPLATTTWDEAELAAMQRVIDSGYFTMGKEVAAFEQEFAAWNGSRHAVMVNSGSSANLLMVAALFFREHDPLRPGDEVLVPAVSWSTTYAPLSQYGLKIRLVDIDIDTLNFDLDALSDAISDRTRLIFAVNLLGNPNDFEAIDTLIGDRDITVIEDNCESMGAVISGRKTGSIGAMGSFSCFFSHHISTMEGGLILTDEEDLYHILLSLRAHGWTRNLPDVTRIAGRKHEDPFFEAFRFVLPGYNVRPLELSGAIGREQLAKLDGLVAGRRRNAAVFQQVMKDHELIGIQRETGESSWFGFSMVIKQGVDYDRAALRHELDELGFEYRPIVAGNFADQKMLDHMDVEPFGSLPNASWIQQHGLFIGNHHYDVSDRLAPLAGLGKGG